MDNDCKESLIKDTVAKIYKNYDLVSDVYESDSGFPTLDPVRNEICVCIMCGLNQAAVTLTNHYLESCLKKLVILAESRDHRGSLGDITRAFKSPTDKYAKKSLFEMIEITYSKGLITEDEKELLHQFRKLFRNPFSHANTKETFRFGTIPILVINKDEINNLDDLAKLQGEPNAEVDPADFLPIQGILQALISEEVSEKYFRKVDEIIFNIITRTHGK